MNFKDNKELLALLAEYEEKDEQIRAHIRTLKQYSKEGSQASSYYRTFQRIPTYLRKIIKGEEEIANHKFTMKKEDEENKIY